MNTKDIENAINHITTLQERLCCAENNLQYIKITSIETLAT